MNNPNAKTAKFHLPGLFEFTDFYEKFLSLFFERRNFFYDWVEISSIYGSPSECIWGGGRAGFGKNDFETEKKAFELCKKYGISPRLTFSNSLIEEKHLKDKKCNRLCETFQKIYDRTVPQETPAGNKSPKTKCGTIVHSDILLDYLKSHFPDIYFVSSTTKVLTDFNDFEKELNRKEFDFVVPDFRLNKDFSKLENLTDFQKNKVEFLCNECCWFDCKNRKDCYENVSKKVLGIPCSDHKCASPESKDGYIFSKAMKNPGFIGINDIKENYLPMGFSNFKIEGRSLGSALILEFLLYYLTKTEYFLNVREEIYLDNTLDLF